MPLLGRRAAGTVAYMGGVPAVLEKFCWSWGQMVAFNAEFLDTSKSYIHYERATISDHGPARNGLVSSFIGSWLLQMDTDHLFEPDIVARMTRLADAYEIDVLSAVYQLKSPPHVPVLYQWVKIGDADKPGLQPMAKWPPHAKLVEIGSAGAGCLFVRRSVFDRIADNYEEGPFDKIHPFSEDHSFFLRCKELGIKCYAAMHVHSHHLRIEPVTLDDLDDSGLAVSELFPVNGFS